MYVKLNIRPSEQRNVTMRQTSDAINRNRNTNRKWKWK